MAIKAWITGQFHFSVLSLRFEKAVFNEVIQYVGPKLSKRDSLGLLRADLVCLIPYCHMHKF